MDPDSSSPLKRPTWHGLRHFVGRLKQHGLKPLRNGHDHQHQQQSDNKETPTTHERTLISNIREMRDAIVADVMVPRADIVAIELGTSFDEFLAIIAERPHSRIPVYRDTLDDVIGMIHLKDVLVAIGHHKPFDIGSLMRDVLIVSPAMPVLDLLQEMRQMRQHIAMIVDEFGGIDGMVTIEDLVEEIVGEIEDEHERGSTPEIHERPDGSLIADGRVDVEDFEELVGTILNDEEREYNDTLGGLVFTLAGRVPARGELIKHGSGIEFEVLDADPRRVKRLRIFNLPKKPDQPTT